MTPDFSRQIRVAFLALFLNFLVFGAITTIVGATLPMVIQALEWSYVAAGTVIAAISVGYFTATLVSGLLVQRWGFRKLISLGLVLQAVGIGCFGITPNILVNVVAFLLLGIGQGATELVTNYCVVQMEQPGRSWRMNLMHSAFTLGAILAPVVTGILTSLDVGWRLIYLLLAALSLGMSFLFLGNSLRFLEAKADGGIWWRNVLGSLRAPFLLLLTLTLFLYVGVEMGVSNWVAEYTVQTFQAPPARAAYIVSVFWAGILLGRLSTSLLYHGDRQPLVLLLFSGASACFLIGALLSKTVVLSSILFFCTGLGYSVIYPTVMSLVGHTFTEKRGMAIGITAAGGGVGMCLFPLLMSGIADYYNIQAGFWFYVVVTSAMVATAGGVFYMSLGKRSGR